MQEYLRNAYPTPEARLLLPPLLCLGRTTSKLLHCIGDFERISDHAVNLGDAAKEMQEKGLKFSDKAAEELAVFTRVRKHKAQFNCTFSILKTFYMTAFDSSAKTVDNFF